MTSEPLVSVIIPVYNRCRTIAAALSSALGQSVRNIEVLLVDDGSNDGLPDALTPFADDPRLRIFHHARRRGAAAARNTAIAAARGEWLAFLDSDDSWRPGKLAAQLAALAAAGPSVRMALTASLLNRGDCEMQLRLPVTIPSCRGTMIRGCTQCPGSAAMVRRAAFADHGPYDEDLLRLEDWDWLLRYTRRDTFIVVPEPFTIVNIQDHRIAADVDAACKIIWRRHAAEIRREGLRAYRSFASAVLIERAFPRLVARRYASGLPLLLAALALDASGTEIIHRLARRLRRPWARARNRTLTSAPPLAALEIPPSDTNF